MPFLRNQLLYLPCLLCAALVSTPCGAASARDTFCASRITLDNAEGFVVVLNDALRGTVSCTGLQERKNAEETLSVVVNLKNMSTDTVSFKVRSIFFYPKKKNTSEKSEWRIITLRPKMTEPVYFASTKGYTETYNVEILPLVPPSEDKPADN